MCCCGKPNVNGTPNAYSWDGKTFSTRAPNPPALAEHDVLLTDDPGRCGGLDCHCHHFRVVRQHGSFYLLVRHGGGDERISLSMRPGVKEILDMEPNARFWALQLLYQVQYEAAKKARDNERHVWQAAALQKRIKTSRRGRQHKVWIEDAAPAANRSESI